MSRNPMPPYGPLGIGSGPIPAQTGRVAQLVEQTQQAREVDAPMRRVSQYDPRTLEQSAGFGRAFFDLATLGTPQLVTKAGYGLIYRKSGSAPGGRLDLDVGGKVVSLAPGSVLRGPFRQFELARSAESAQAGRVELVVLTRPDVDLEEPQDLENMPAAPASLLGTVADTGVTYVAVNENTRPAGSPAYAFSIDGWRRLRVMVNAVGLESAEIVWWTKYGGVWFENDTSNLTVISLPASGVAYATRSFILNVAGRGQMAPEVRNLLPAALTALEFAVEGLE